MENEIFKIMIGAPSDAEEYVLAAIQQIEQWNAIYSDTFHITIQPLHWSLNTYPQVGHPQRTINDAVVPNSQMLIAIFNEKLGNPTENAESGTIEEINLHIEQGKNVQVYFCKKPRGTSNGESQRIQKYKESIMNSIIYGEYSSVEDFKNLFSKNLAQCMLNYILGVGWRLESEKIYSSIQTLIKVWSQSEQELVFPEVGPDGYVCIHIEKAKYSFLCCDIKTKAKLIETYKYLMDKGFIREGYDNYGKKGLALTNKGFELADLIEDDPVFGDRDE